MAIDDGLIALFERMPQGVAFHEAVVKDGERRDYRFLAVNPAFLSHTGLSPGQVLGKLATEIFGLQVAPYAEVFFQVVESQETRRFETFFAPLNRHLSVAVLPLGGERFATVLSDITQRKEQQEALRRSEADLLRSQRVARLGSYRMDVREGSWNCTPMLDELFGVDPRPVHHLEEWIASLHPADRDEMIRYFGDEVVGKGKAFDHEYRIIRAQDGRTAWVYGRGELEKAADGTVIGMFGTIQDVTERHRAEAAVARSREALLSVSELAHIGHFDVEPERGEDTWTDELFRIVGVQPGQVKPSRDELVGWLLDDDRRRVSQAMTEVARQPGARRLEVRGTWPNGEVRHALIILEGEPPDSETAAKVHGMVWDLTDLRRAEEERRKLELTVLQSQKLESLGLMAGGIAHDFNNLLTAILGNATLASHELADDAVALEHIKDIELASRRAADLARQMLAYSGRGRFVVQPVSLNDLVQEMGELLAVSMGKKARLIFDLSATLPAVIADATQMRQVIMNLITNANEALTERGGTIHIKTSHGRCERAVLEGLVGDRDLVPGEFVVLEVTDDGLGMSADILGRIFDPFFTTKFTGRGLGLAAVQGIVRGHDGGVQVTSEVGRGTTFRVFLPASREAPCASTGAEADDDARASLRDPWRGEGLVLVVDDEEQVRRLCRRMLERRGFDVIAVEDGLAALAVFRERHATLKLVVMDVTMPKIDGEACFREMHAHAPEVPVILTSGFHEQEVVARFAKVGPAAFVQKPYTEATLLPRIKAALARPGT